MEKTFGTLKNKKEIEKTVQQEINYWQRRSKSGTDNGSFFEILQPLAEKLELIQVKILNFFTKVIFFFFRN